MGKIYFVRHGQTDRNVEEMMNPGDVDSELNKTGIEQAISAGEDARSKGISFDVIISSPLIRALHTAEKIAIETGYTSKIILDDRLKEQFAGKLKDYSHEEFEKEFDLQNTEAKRRFFKSKQNNGIEDASDFVQRVTECFNEIKQKYAGKNVLLVAHSGTARAVFINSLGLDEDTTMFISSGVKNAQILDTDVNPFENN